MPGRKNRDYIVVNTVTNEKTIMHGTDNLEKNFKVYELASRLGSDYVFYNPVTLKKVQKCRDYYGRSIRITCGGRDLTHNRKVKSKDTSEHLALRVGGGALDVRPPRGETPKGFMATYEKLNGKKGGRGTYTVERFCHFDEGRDRTWKGSKDK